VSAKLKKTLLCQQPTEKRKIIPLWIDALCINQNDIQERNNQVQQMRQIYQASHRVIIHLDIEIDPNHPAFRRLDLLNHKGVDVSFLGRDANFWQPLIPIFQHPYWGRVWIQQEASQNPFVQLNALEL
jgi:Heterokaryon incompatibility protein (HET)